MTEVEPYLRRVVDRFADPGMQKAFRGFTRTLQFRFTDTGESWLLRIVDGRYATLTEEAVEKPDILVEITTDDLAGVMRRRLHPVKAYTLGRIHVKGEMPDLLKLSRLLR